jgi:hypothetical protein
MASHGMAFAIMTMHVIGGNKQRVLIDYGVI